MPDLLNVERLTAGYGEAVVLTDVTFKVAEGQTLALLGRNGMGKTTLVNSIVGVTTHIGGSITLDGRDTAARGRLHDLAERLVPDHAAPRHAVVEVPLVDVQVGAADPDALDAHERLARLRHRPGRRARRERARTLIE